MLGLGPDTSLDMQDAAMRGHDEAVRRRRFEALYAQHHAQVLGYALRRLDSPDEAADVLAETFLVAWRRLEVVPEGERSCLWLYGVARRVLANHRRGEHRRTQLADRLREELAARLPLADAPGAGTSLAVAFRSLSDGDRELLALQGWEGLAPAEIAAVLGCSHNAARIRLHRARRRLRAALAGAEPSEVSSDMSAPHASAGPVDPILMKGEVS
jgi:RNA polymerase sigma-70 factor (ECF subfamily)